MILFSPTLLPPQPPGAKQALPNPTEVPPPAEVAGLFADFERETGRKLHLEIEPGTYLAARAGTPFVAKIGKFKIL